VFSDLLLDELRASRGYFYISTPYTKYHAGIETAYIEACKVTAWLVRRNVNVYSPISHSHGPAIHGDIDALSHAIWMPQQQPMMEAAHGLIVVKMLGWDESRGVAEEIAYFSRAGKPCHFMEWPQ